MHSLPRLTAAAFLVFAVGQHPQVNAQTPPYQLTKVSSGYTVSGLPAELIQDFLGLPREEEVVLSLVDPSYGISKVQGYGRVVNTTTLSIVTGGSFLFHPDLNRTYLVFELKNPPAGGGSCSGCTLTNKNLKARSPQICWCFSKLASTGSGSQCGTESARLRFPAPSESTFQLKALVDEPGRTAAIYHECYPSSGPGGEDCSLFNDLCTSSGGGSSSLPGGGYGCHVP